MKKIIFGWFGLLILLQSPVALALVDGSLMIGLRNGKFKGENTDATLKASELAISAHIDPIPLVPVAFGLSLISDTYQDEGNQRGWSSTSIAPEVMAWLPWNDFKFYGRLGYSIYSAYRGKFASSAGDTEISAVGYGPRLAAGVKWGLAPLVAVLAEYNMANEKIKFTKADFNGIDVKGQIGSYEANSSAILVGVEIGL